MPRRAPAASALVTLALAGCLGGSSPTRSYFAVEYPRGEAVKRYTEPRYPFTVRVRPFESSVAYDRQELVYRQSAYEISYDWYRLWAAKPRHMLGALVRGHLRDANLFREVVDRLSGTLPRYELGCEVLGLEELDSAKDTWFARLALRCVLIDFTTSAQVWSHAFDVKERVYQRTPHFVVRALSQLMEREMVRLIDALDAYLAEATGRPAPRLGDTAAPGASPEGPPPQPPAPDARPDAPPTEPAATLRPRGR